ncbi:type II toxin-antitoxin system CcdA family antitoxin [Lentilactobacillus otakiensis]|uniref:type II toxin-antitoxin system CcdA family antitoxin n=1 Tax=Lentilactobacillus otakiensis TaxID=481720 RepID=UPI003D17188A
MEKKQNIVIYPAIFDPDTDGINVTFPDVPEAITYGKDDTDAAYYANDVLGLVLANRKKLPTPSPIKNIQLSGDQYIVMIVTDLHEAKKKIKNPTVRKNTTIPADLNEKAKQAGINFSEVLTDALREKLGE